MRMTTKKNTATKETRETVDTRSLKEQALEWVKGHGCIFHSNYRKYLGLASFWTDADPDRFEKTDDGIIIYRSLVTSDYLRFDEKSIFILKSMTAGKIPTLRIYMCDGTPRSMTGDQDVFVDGFGALFDASQKTEVTPKCKAGYEKIIAAFKYDDGSDLIPESVKKAKTPESRLAACISEWQDTCSRPLVVHKWIICECLAHTVCQPRALDPKLLLSFIPQEWYVKQGGSSSYGIGELITQMANGAFCNYLPSVQKPRSHDFHYTPIRHLVACVCVIARGTDPDLIRYWLKATDTDVTARRSTGGSGTPSSKTPKLSPDQALSLLD